MSRVIAIIPARMGSSRYPGKPLANLLGRPMIEHVYRRTDACDLVSDTIVATCDDEIRVAVESFGGRAVMTSADHERASERVAEAAESATADVFVMVQGDEPMTHPDMVDTAVRSLLEDEEVGCVNLVARISSEEEVRNPNTIKVVMSRAGDALFFSRSTIPALHARPFESGRWYKQVCIIPFRPEVLRRFATLEPTPLEQAESVDMLRLLEHGDRVRMVRTEFRTHAVDTPEDLPIVEERLREDPFTGRYMEVR